MSNSTEGTSTEVVYRTENFTPAGPVDLRVSLISGDTTAVASGDGSLTVRLRARGRRAEQRLADTIVNFDVETGALQVRSPLRGEGSGGLHRFWVATRDGDVDVEVQAPEGSSLTSRTASGDVAVTGPWRLVDAASGSGDVRVADVQDLVVKIASGDVVAASIGARLDVKTTSGDVEIASLRGDAKVVCVSGDVRLGVSGAATVDVHAVSGDVDVNLSEGLTVTVDAKTVSGDLKSEIDLGDSTPAGDPGEAVTLRVGTVSGDVHLRRGLGSMSGWRGRVSQWIQHATSTPPNPSVG